ncbi:MAG: hypothetical protein HZC22_10960 [Rhodocyclales bacterium]|nr:hypothetical protein [Rhodocyclales bacterium]
MTEIRAVLGHPAALLAWLPLLIGLQGVPHTGAFRTLFLLLGIGHTIWLARSLKRPLPGLHGGGERTAFWLLTAWLVLQSAVLAHEPLLSLRTLAGDWGKLLLMAALGWWLARVLPSTRWLVVALFCGAFLHVLTTLGLQPVSLATGNGIVYRRSLLADYALTSPFTTTAFVWLLADAAGRLWHGRGLFPWSATTSAVLALMALAAEALLQAKSGQVLTVVLIAVACLALLRHPRLGRPWSIGMAAATVIVVGLLVMMGGSRWFGLGQSFDKAWREPIPVQVVVTDNVPMAAGINHSLYMRAVRARVGIEGIAEHPWGLGFDPDVFSRYVKERFGIPQAISSSNSGLIDFTLASGVVGLCLLLILAASLMRCGWRAFVAGRPEGAALALLVLHHLGRYALDGTLGGSRLTGTALAIGALWALSVMEKREGL